LIVLEWALGLFAFLPCWLFIRGKTARRTSAISQNGIDTQIGEQRGNVPWRKVTLVKDTGDVVLIGRTNGNYFSVPDRAFSGDENRSEFLAEIERLRKQDLEQKAQ
jgi:YcxB-like protein